MKIYVDFDDCLCETAKAFTGIADKLFGKKVPYEKVRFFSLQESFELDDEEYKELMEYGHRPEVLMAYEETPGASQVLNEWIDQGHEVYIITGRPYNCYEASRGWLDAYGLSRVNVYFLDKYGRNGADGKYEYNMTLEEYYDLKFDFAVEDSPLAFRFFEHLPKMQVLVFDRPWNCDSALPGENYTRCKDWAAIAEIVKKQSEL
ncbi:MAG: 2-dehydropantoate 2-reductase [Lachnospiraceae bacterium]|nr:2-dehydropantoate 2-reductase [Lachnospiraceae bacterium]